MIELVQRIASAGGKLWKLRRGWSYGDVFITKGEATRLFAARMVERVSDNCIALTPLARSHCGTAGRGPMAGAEVDYRLDGHCERGRVIAAGLYQAIVWASGRHAGHVRDARHPEGYRFQRGPVHALRRPRVSAPWKFSGADAVGAYRPDGRHPMASVVWPLLVAGGHVPATWFAPPVGAPCTLARLVDVAQRLVQIGAAPVSVEERAAAEVCLTGGSTPLAPNLANVRTALRRLGRLVEWGDDPAEEVMVAAYHAEIARVEHAILHSRYGLQPFGEEA